MTVHRRVDGVSFGRSSALAQVVREAYEGNEPQALA